MISRETRVPRSRDLCDQQTSVRSDSFIKLRNTVFGLRIVLIVRIRCARWLS